MMLAICAPQVLGPATSFPGEALAPESASSSRRFPKDRDSAPDGWPSPPCPCPSPPQPREEGDLPAGRSLEPRGVGVQGMLLGQTQEQGTCGIIFTLSVPGRPPRHGRAQTRLRDRWTSGDCGAHGGGWRAPGVPHGTPWRDSSSSSSGRACDSSQAVRNPGLGKAPAEEGPFVGAGLCGDAVGGGVALCFSRIQREKWVSLVKTLGFTGLWQGRLQLDSPITNQVLFSWQLRGPPESPWAERGGISWAAGQRGTQSPGST